MVLDVQLTHELSLMQCCYQEDNIVGMRFIHRYGAFFAVVRISEYQPEWIGFSVLIIENISTLKTEQLLQILSPHKEAIQHYYKLCIEQQFGG